MKKLLLYFLLFFGGQLWSQDDTLVEENIRKIGDILYQNLDETIYGSSLLNRSFSTNEITLQQVKGNYNQIHSVIEFFNLYQDIAYSYLDSTTLMDTKTLGDFITNEFKMNEYNNSTDRLVQPFGFLIHTVSAIDSTNFDIDHFQRSEYSLIPLVDQNTLYTKKLLKSCALIEFYPESGYRTGFLKYTPELISASENITNLNLFINVGNGYVQFDDSSPLIEYDRTRDSIIGLLAYNYQINDTIYFDTLQFYLTTKGEDIKRDPNPSYWQYVGEYGNSTSIKFDIGMIFGCGNTTLHARRPIIIVPPYRPSVQPFSMQQYYNQFNFSNLMNELAEKGYDIFFIKLKPGNESLELAAQALAEYITMLNQNKKEEFPDEDWENILMGYSMGGQIARYCLKKMEKEHMDNGAPHHHTRLYIPFDSPHLGANIPMFTQAVYKDLRYTNIFAMMGYLSLVDEASRDMGICDIEGSITTIENNGGGDPKIYHILPDIAGVRKNFLNDLYTNLNHQFTAPVGDMRRSFPVFTRNIAISTGANDQDYNDLYSLYPGKLLFHQSAIGYGYGTLYYKLRRVYASERVDDHTVFRNKEQILTFLVPITVKNRDYRVIYGEEFDLAQGGYKDEFYDKLAGGFAATGVVSILRTSAFGFGQKEYNGHMGFLPMVSALAINKSIWGYGGNFHYNLKDQGLMYKSLSDIPLIKSETYGYPNLGHPSDHFNITPFEAIYCDPQTYEHIKMDASITDNGGYSPVYLINTKDFILNEVEADDVYLQNKVIGNNHVQWDPNYTYNAWYKAKNKLTIGKLVTPKTDPGDYVIKASGDITVYAGQEISIKPGFHTQHGSDFHAFIQADCDPNSFSGGSQKNMQQSTTTSEQNNAAKEVRSVPLEISIFPNPSHGLLTVLFPQKTIGSYRLVAIQGQVIQTGQVDPDNTEIQFQLEKGIYFMQYTTDEKNVITKQIHVL